MKKDHAKLSLLVGLAVKVLSLLVLLFQYAAIYSARNVRHSLYIKNLERRLSRDFIFPIYTISYSKRTNRTW